MQKSLYIFLGFLLSVCSQLPLHSSAQSYNFHEISLQQGLPQSQAYALLFDSTQHVWIGTQGGGLCRYDGFEFDYFTKNDSLISNRIYCIRQIDHQIWVGQKGGISIFEMNTKFFKNYELSDPARVVQDIIKFDGELLFCTDNGLMHLKEYSIQPYTKNVSLREVNTTSFFQVDDQLWICSSKGLLNFESSLKKINRAKGLSAEQVTAVSVFGENWIIGTYGGGIDVYNPRDKTLENNFFQDLGDDIVLSLFVNDEDELWVGTLNKGIYVFSKEGQLKKKYQSTNGLVNDHVRVIMSDLWGNIWIGTSGGGVCIFQNSPFIKYNNSSGLNGDYIYSVLNSSKGNLWSGTDGLAVVRVNDTTSVTFDEEYGFHSEKVKALFEDKDGDIWMGTEGRGLGIFSQYDGKDTIYTYSSEKGLQSDWIKCFEQHPVSKTIFIGTLGAGVITVKKDWQFPININFQQAKVNTGNFPDRITHLNFIGNQLWFISSNGEFGYFEKGKVKTYTVADALFRNCVGVENKRWLGSADEGILVLDLAADSIDQKNWISQKDGLSSNNIYQLLLNGFDLWVGTEKGLDRIEFDSTYQIQKIVHFGYEEGFEGVETNINAVDKDKDGGLWFGSVNGIYKYQGGEINYQQRQPPALQLTDFSIFYESIEHTDYADHFEQGEMVKELLLPYEMNHIGFSFKAIHYIYSKNIRYRWILVGADPDWTPPSKITTATYSNLQAGDYTFKVKASIDDNWDTEPLTLSFSIDQPYYEKFWFKMAYYSVIILVFISIVVIIFLRIRRKNRRLREKFEMEKNLIELEQKALRLQMNPHFIFNVLTSIHNLIILNDPDKARYALSKFSKLMRRVLENSREKLIAIDDEVETLENYVQLEKLTSNLNLELIVDIADDIDSSEELLPPLMIQPFVENAVIHGFKGTDRPGKIIVRFKLIHEHLLECTVEDNGIGREMAAGKTSQKENYHKSTALEVTQERLANLNPTAKFVPFEIIDLKDEKGQALGTKVIFRLEV
ncbi:MAG: two-component regulator propeller domain-containing protein [Crocinitomicaceae bacterium]